MTTHVGVQSGDGLVARFGDAVVVIGPAADEAFINALLAALEDAAGSARSAADIAWELAALLGQHREDAPAFGLAVPVAEGQLILLHGSVQATSGAVHLTGHDALTWVDHVLTAVDGPIAITLADDAVVQPSPRSDLRGGMVPGNGVVLTLSQAAAPTAAPAEPATPEPESAADPATRETAPWSVVDDEPAVDKPVVDKPVVDKPVVDEPAAPPEPARETMAAGPAPAALVSDEGARAPLDRAYVLGREPQYDEAVAHGTASPIVVADPDNMISRVQAYVWLDRNGVFVRDAKSANGTFVAAPGATDWVRLTDQPALLPVGWSLRIGRRVFTHVGPEQAPNSRP